MAFSDTIRVAYTWYACFFLSSKIQKRKLVYGVAEVLLLFFPEKFEELKKNCCVPYLENFNTWKIHATGGAAAALMICIKNQHIIALVFSSMISLFSFIRPPSCRRAADLAVDATPGLLPQAVGAVRARQLPRAALPVHQGQPAAKVRKSSPPLRSATLRRFFPVVCLLSLSVVVCDRFVLVFFEPKKTSSKNNQSTGTGYRIVGRAARDVMWDARHANQQVDVIIVSAL